MQVVSPDKLDTAAIVALEAAPTLVTDGIETIKFTEAVMWWFTGGTSATITYYVYSESSGAWAPVGTEAFTGSKAVLQQAGGARMHARITTHGGGSYKRSFQRLRGS